MCYYENNFNTKVCENCGHKLDLNAQKLKKCPECSFECEATLIFCEMCTYAFPHCPEFKKCVMCHYEDNFNTIICHVCRSESKATRNFCETCAHKF